MKLWSDSFKDGEKIQADFAFAKHHPESHVEMCPNRNPHLAWDGVPAGTKSLVLICHDTDVPTKPDDVNKEGRTVPASLPRTEFYHWVLVDLPADGKPITAGEFSKEITARGKAGPAGPRGTRQGKNDYTVWFSGDKDMEGTYFGYDGPCPPWNDEIVHHYHFTLYALDVDRCPVEGEFTGPEVVQAIEGHILDKVSITGLYAINPQAG